MYKKSLVILLLFLLISICSSLCKAEVTAKVYLTSNKYVVKVQDEFEISLNIENEKTAAYNVNIYFDNKKLELVSVPENVNVKDNRIIIVWYDKQGGNGALEGILESLNFKAKAEGVATFEISGEFYDKAGNEIQTSFETSQIIIGSDKNILESER